VNSFMFSMEGFLSASLVKDRFAGYSNVGWQPFMSGLK
jgi:hypothetical protein